MGYAIADMSYQNLNALVQYIHNKVYTGTNNRNRYQLNHHIYVWWNAGKVTKIMDMVRHQSIDLTKDNPETVNNVDSLGNIGFYADVTKMLDEAVHATQPERTIRAYTRQDAFHRVLVSNTDLLLDVFA